MIDTIIENQSRKHSAAEVERLNRKKDRNKSREGTSKPSPKKGYFVNNTNRTSQTTSNTYTLYFNADTPLWSEENSSEEEDIVMRKGRRKSNVENKNEELKGESSEEGYIKIPECNRKGHVETVNEETKENSSEEGYIVILYEKKLS